ncbi:MULTISPECIES: carbohydrate ABC transporter permease [unclassified Lactococcus]|uniref:carbohydrate ABC transporter permease n=1 Tax=unclassified Lactococcus TaxID=2643510 RepID=UPI0011C8D6C8|nr:MULTISPECIES: sugar ABC transporter permease [unclassified Lactococcus]MQW22087.1 ABC transporter permease subunit [Lactococcus sp. dk101]TXK45029.1 sugar ABC transporter permease [Lactococcus sp. dk310]TXK51190.1 sugar ABC transporter permease [Lactococcus sp. dk322]
MFKRKIKLPPEATFKEVWTKGDLATKLSFFIMGTAQLKNKQWLKGLVFLFTEIFFFAWLIIGGLSALSGLSNLGANKTIHRTVDAQGYPITVQPDASLPILLYGVLAIIVVALLIYIYYVSLKSTRHLFALNRDGKHIPTTKEDLKSLLDDRIHQTLMTIPLLGILLFTVLPLMINILVAFTNYDFNHQIGFSWTGFEAFGKIFTQGNIANTFFSLLIWTIVWAILATYTTFFFGILLALLIEKKGVKFKGFWRTLFVIVFAMPQFMSLLMMSQFFADGGPINTWLQSIHVIGANNPIPFLSDPTFAKVTVLLVNMWIGIPVSMLLATAIIQNISQDQVEAAKIDGANTFQVFRSITFPQILFVMTPALIQQFVGNINNFNVIYLLTGGAPLNANFYQAGSTDLLVTWLFNLTMKGGIANYNIGSAIGIFIFIVVAGFSLITYRRTSAFKEGAN